MHPVAVPLPSRVSFLSARVQAREVVFSEAAAPGEPPLAPLRRLAHRLQAAGAEIVGLMLFGSFSAREPIEAALVDALGPVDWPTLWIEGASCHDAPLAGAQAFALQGGQITRVSLGGRVVASRYRLGRAELCWVGESLPTNRNASPGEQTTEAFQAMERALEAAGFGLGELVRTWCYNHELLTWYPEFNDARTRLYRRIDFVLGATPASTGISAANRADAALVLAGLAVRSLSGGPVARPLSSPLQCPAPAYGSSFSRAVELDLGAVRRILVSGTASIEPGGATVWQGEIWNQIDLTMQVIAAILSSRGMVWDDVTRGIAYCKSPEFASVFEAWCLRRGWKTPPVINLHCDICRDDLLFELELDAEVPTAA